MTIYGECIGTRARTPVTISQLASTGCDLLAETDKSMTEGLIDLWIGAIGPLPVIAEGRGPGRFAARFREPLDERIIAHFAIS